MPGSLLHPVEARPAGTYINVFSAGIFKVFVPSVLLGNSLTRFNAVSRAFIPTWAKVVVEEMKLVDF